ncbi:MAG TPA: amino acid permease [Kouleothrix sp.]|uniref:amino acid permease n=1 Tax=Kouleothrix sp. TaxID=2779161 RepID=UPI002C13E3E1|nr:amino acid permease [Kouleothrix sp.]HRC77327.1 amino acid permease [Kouleothrix sp.]
MSTNRNHPSGHGHDHDADVRELHSMGYAQELLRRMSGFSNFAISFAIICIVAGGLTAFQTGFNAAGGGAIGIGWPVGALFALIVALAMAQIASAYPTAGGLYHWSSILGGKGWGWATAWYNLLGLVFVVASVDVGLFFLLNGLILGPWFGVDLTQVGNIDLLGTTFSIPQFVIVTLIVVTQALFNHFGIRVTTLLTDFSGYLIFATAIVLTLALLAFAPSLDFGRLFTFTNYTGDPGAGVWPATDSLFKAFLLGLLLVCYTITGFDASAHTSEETRDAARIVPRGMIQAVFWSGLFGYVMVCALVLAMPSLDEGAGQGANVFYWLLGNSAMPGFLRALISVGIVLSNYLCALAGLTSLSRMTYAFARDGGLPGSNALKTVSAVYRTPVVAIWVGAALTVIGTLYAPAFTVLAAGCAVFLYLSYAMPIAAGLLAEGRSWKHKGPFNLGAFSRPVALLAIIGGLILAWVGFQPPNEKVLYVGAALAVVMVVIWFAFERRRFEGPPTGEKILARQAEIAAIEERLRQGQESTPLREREAAS